MCVGGLLQTDPQERAKTTTASSGCRPRPTSACQRPAASLPASLPAGPGRGLRRRSFLIVATKVSSTADDMRSAGEVPGF